MKSDLPIKGTTKACRLKKTAKGWFLYMPTNVPVNDVANRKTVCSSDPGTRTFQTVYSPGPVANIYEFGVNYSKKVKGLLNRIDADNKFKDKPWYSKYLKRLRDKIRHLTEDIQWKTAKYLATNFETVLIGNLSTISCLKGKKLTKMNKRILQSASHYSFRQRLKNKCAEWNSKFVEVDESYTSKTCGGCGFIKEDLEGAKVFDCNKCRLRIGRDVNGARNIMIKKLK
jgi:IS605 OrfB family transposase